MKYANTQRDRQRTFQRKEILSLLAFLPLLFALNYRLLTGWFMVDDTAMIFCSGFDTIRLLFDKGTYLYFNQLFFTPLLPISFKIDWYLFKMNPAGYHLHNMLAAWFCCILLYVVLRNYLKPFFAWLGVMLFAISLPVSFDIGWITRRHYLWGFFFMLVAVHFFTQWENDKKPFKIILSLVCTLISLLFKEAYAVLPLFVLLLATGSPFVRIRKSIPFLIVLVMYLLWRLFILGSMGGYPGFSDTSFLVLSKKMITMPFDLSGSLFGLWFLPIALVLLIGFFDIRVALLTGVAAYMVMLPFIFSPATGFLMANKALAFTAVFSFMLAYLVQSVFRKNKWMAAAVIAFIYIPILVGAFSKTLAGQEVVMKLSGNFEKVSNALIESKNRKVLTISNYAYYFSNLEDIYRNMLKHNFPVFRSLSSTVGLPYLDMTYFDTVIIAENFDLLPEKAARSSVTVLNNSKSERFLQDARKRKTLSPQPEVLFTPHDDHLRITIHDMRKGIYMRCLHMGSYVGCSPIPKDYTFRYNTVKKIRKIDIIYMDGEDGESKPATFENF
jgi:hypothetical protein